VVVSPGTARLWLAQPRHSGTPADTAQFEDQQHAGLIRFGLLLFGEAGVWIGATVAAGLDETQSRRESPIA
jgi:hypothetical protein